MPLRFHKYQALGNTYLVVEPGSDEAVSEALVRRLCDLHYGVGSDGVLIGGPGTRAGFSLAIFNPDGSEAEKSGNGLRIFARYLWDSGRVPSDQSAQVEYAGQPLASRTRCFWKVRVWDQLDQPAPWSKPATWSMGRCRPGIGRPSGSARMRTKRN